MNKLKTLNKKEIKEMLTLGDFVLYVDTIDYKVYIVDKLNKEKLGAVRFNTYLQINIKAMCCYTGYSYNLYEYVGGSIWNK